MVVFVYCSSPLHLNIKLWTLRLDPDTSKTRTLHTHHGRKSLSNSPEKHIKCCISVVPAFEPTEQNFELRCTLQWAHPGKFCLIQKKSVVCHIPHVLRKYCCISVAPLFWPQQKNFELSGWILTTHTYTAHTKKSLMFNNFISSEGALYVILPYDYPTPPTFWTHTGP